MLLPERKRDFIESAYLQYYLELQGYKLIFVDEFHVNMRSTSLYNWSKIGQPATLVADPDPWTMSFILGISKEMVEGILASDWSINSKSFTWFIYDIWKNNVWGKDKKGKQVIILDNSSVHNSKKSLTFMKKKGIKCLSIPPYSPQLNAAEKVIGAIKSSLKTKWIEGKGLSLAEIKRIVDKMTPQSWAKWIYSSKFETFWKMKNFEFWSE